MSENQETPPASTQLAYSLADEAPHVASSPPPASVTMAQARVALHRSGLLAAVQAAVAASPDPEVTITWEYSTVVSRDSALVTALAGGLGLTESDLDALFTSAAAITF